MSKKSTGRIWGFRRKRELKVLLDRIQAGQSVAIIAPRRFGKTSLIRQVLQQSKGNNTSTAFIDLLSNSTPELLSTTLIKEALKNHKLHKEFLAARQSVGSFYISNDLLCKFVILASNNHLR